MFNFTFEIAPVYDSLRSNAETKDITTAELLQLAEEIFETNPAKAPLKWRVRFGFSFRNRAPTCAEYTQQVPWSLRW
jgi:hypothetical protein